MNTTHTVKTNAALHALNPHTPGPWQVARGTWGGEPCRHVTNAAGCPLASLQHCAEDAANARLMATAPKLLDLLQRALCMTGPANSDANLQWFHDVRTAIAIATGGAQ